MIKRTLSLSFVIEVKDTLVVFKENNKKFGEAKYFSYLTGILIIKVKIMRKYIRALEIPFYLFVFAVGCLERGHTGLGIFLFVISVIRLIVNVSFDEFIYKR